VGSSASWVVSISCICAPLRGTLLPSVLLNSSVERAVAWGSLAHILGLLTMLVHASMRDWPWAAGLVSLRCEPWNDFISMRMFVQVLLDPNSSPYYSSGDNMLVDGQRGLSFSRPVMAHLRRVYLFNVLSGETPPFRPLRAAARLTAVAVAAAALAAAWRQRREVRQVLARLLAALLALRVAHRSPLLRRALLALLTLLNFSQARRRGAFTAAARSAAGALGVAAVVAAVVGHERRRALARACALSVARAILIQPTLALGSYALQREAAALELSGSGLARRLRYTLGGGGKRVRCDGVIELPSQIGVSVPGLPRPCSPARSVALRGRTRSWEALPSLHAIEEEGANGEAALATSFSSLELRALRSASEAYPAPNSLAPGAPPCRSPPPARGKWYGLEVVGADHSLGTSFCVESAPMYAELLAHLRALRSAPRA
jgi:hypothetical protein